MSCKAIWLFLLFSTYVNAELIVKEFSTKPNYTLSKSVSDKRDLTDGRIDGYPMWTKKTAVVWKNISPIKISLKSSGFSSAKKGRLIVHSSAGSHVGIYPIERIDVYGGDSELSLIGEYQNTTSNITDKKNYFIAIDVEIITKNIELIIHIKEGYVVLGEITLEEVGAASEEMLEKKRIEDIASHSSGRLKAYYKSRDFKRAPSSDGVEVSNVDCYSRFSLSTDKLIKEDFRLKYISDEDASIQVCFYVSNNSDSKIEVKAVVSDGVVVGKGVDLSRSFYRIEPIVTRKGTVVYDPLVTINNADLLNKGESSYYWVDFKGGRPDYSLEISAGEEKYTIHIEGLIPVCEKKKAIKSINVWSYSDSNTIWGDQLATVDFLRSNGVNIFLVPPSKMPQLKKGAAWKVKAVQDFHQELELYGNLVDGERLLIYTAWRFGRDLKKPIYGGLNQSDEMNVINWTRRLIGLLEENGYDWADWALYPVDEPQKDKVEVLMLVGALLKEEFPEINLYANPSNARAGYMEPKELDELSSIISIWQPSWSYVNGKSDSFFEDFEGFFWVYDVPGYPAKNSEIIWDYRMLAWKAWSIGASGIGVWSFDDTKGSSAWDDFDGPRADWAMVYEAREGDKGVVESRRWKALLRGVEDVSYLGYSVARKQIVKKGILDRNLDYRNLLLESTMVQEKCH